MLRGKIFPTDSQPKTRSPFSPTPGRNWGKHKSQESIQYEANRHGDLGHEVDQREPSHSQDPLCNKEVSPRKPPSPSSGKKNGDRREYLDRQGHMDERRGFTPRSKNVELGRIYPSLRGNGEDLPLPPRSWGAIAYHYQAKNRNLFGKILTKPKA